MKNKTNDLSRIFLIKFAFSILQTLTLNANVYYAKGRKIPARRESIKENKCLNVGGTIAF